MYFYPRPPRGGRLHKSNRYSRVGAISIHVLREEDDRARPYVAMTGKFLSTSSARRTTSHTPPGRAGSRYFYPRPPRGGRLSKDPVFRNAGQFLSTSSARRTTRPFGRLFCCRRNFYPRPPRGGRRRVRWRCISILHFYPRPPRGGRPTERGCYSMTVTISIHVLREEDDIKAGSKYSIITIFLSTSSARRTTAAANGSSPRRPISIHVLREEDDLP